MLCPHLAALKNLQELCLEWCTVEDKSFDDVVGILEKLPALSQVKSPKSKPTAMQVPRLVEFIARRGSLQRLDLRPQSPATMSAVKECDYAERVVALFPYAWPAGRSIMIECEQSDSPS